MSAIDPNRCPLCGGDNACGMQRGAGTCWCAGVQIPATVLTAVPEAARGRACLCARCAGAGAGAGPPAAADADFAPLRREYGDEPLLRERLPDDPRTLFDQWLTAAAAAGVIEPNGMALATVGADGAPHCRIVLLKACDTRGLTFFTNRDSGKGRELAAAPRAAATFWWGAPRTRQVRVEGNVELTSDAESDAYFASRPRAAQLASAASPQSRPVADRAELERLVAELAARIGDGPVPRPAHWGGYRLLPQRFEFWQGRDGRLHDRFRYERGDAGWSIERLAP